VHRRRPRAILNRRTRHTSDFLLISTGEQHFLRERMQPVDGICDRRPRHCGMRTRRVHEIFRFLNSTCIQSDRAVIRFPQPHRALSRRRPSTGARPSGRQRLGSAARAIRRPPTTSGGGRRRPCAHRARRPSSSPRSAPAADSRPAPRRSSGRSSPRRESRGRRR